MGYLESVRSSVEQAYTLCRAYTQYRYMSLKSMEIMLEAQDLLGVQIR